MNNMISLPIWVLYVYIGIIILMTVFIVYLCKRLITALDESCYTFKCYLERLNDMNQILKQQDQLIQELRRLP